MPRRNTWAPTAVDPARIKTKFREATFKPKEDIMAKEKFIIEPHFRLHEWVAEEKGYFSAEGLDYEFRETMGSKDAKMHNLGDKVGAYQTIEKGRTCDVSGACHWTVNVAASAGHGKLYGDAYSV